MYMYVGICWDDFGPFFKLPDFLRGLFLKWCLRSKLSWEDLGAAMYACMYVHAYVCMYMYVYVCICMYMYVRHVGIYMYIMHT